MMLNTKILLVLLICFYSNAMSISFIDIVMEEWQDWKLSHRKFQILTHNISMFI